MVVGGRGELIDTLWNVNCIKGFPVSYKSLELIDTLWNVNGRTTRSSARTGRKN